MCNPPPSMHAPTTPFNINPKATTTPRVITRGGAKQVGPTHRSSTNPCRCSVRRGMCIYTNTECTTDIRKSRSRRDTYYPSIIHQSSINHPPANVQASRTRHNGMPPAPTAPSFAKVFDAKQVDFTVQQPTNRSLRNESRNRGGYIVGRNN